MAIQNALAKHSIADLLAVDLACKLNNLNYHIPGYCHHPSITRGP
jgi:hypothetical protein